MKNHSTFFSFPINSLKIFFQGMVLIFGYSVASPLHCQLNAQTNPKLIFQFQKDDVYIIEKFQDVNIHLSKKRIHKQEKNRIVLHAVKADTKGVFFQGKFITYSRIMGKDSGFKLESQYNSHFFFHFNGQYSKTKNNGMPNIHSIPTFLAESVSKNEKWTLPAKQIINFNNTLYNIPLQVHYTYKGRHKIPEIAKHHPFYKKNSTSGEEIHFQYQFQVSPQNESIKQIKGYAANKIWFDNEKGIPLFALNSLVYAFNLPGQSTPVVYKFQVYTWYHKTQTTKKKEKDRIVSQAQKKLKSNTKITVQDDPKGLKMTMDAINFAPDSASLTEDARQNLQKIAEILEQYPKKEIRISGHTDNRGSASYNQGLSQKRALSVLRELKKLGVSSSRMSYKGHGENKPIASNKTAGGRAKNRRVEILLLTN